tara:strand:+ start:3267 stop:3797 length:531 start_codon:yes stop_codon:yes gene_type:complete
MIQKQIKNLRWRFNNCINDDTGRRRDKPIPMYVNSKDFEALNGIIKYANDEQERKVANNHLFAKLFISVFKNDLIKSDGNYQYIIDSLRMAISLPLKDHYNELFEEMNSIELVKFAESKGISLKHPALRTPEEEEKDTELLKVHQDSMIRHLDHFKKEDVYQRTNKLLNTLIEDYG